MNVSFNAFNAYSGHFNYGRTNDEQKRPLRRQSVSILVSMEGNMFYFIFTVNRCESLIFDVVLKFGFRVAEDDTVSIIQSAIVDGKLGELSENVSFIIGIPPVKQVTAMAPTSTTPKSDGLFLVLTDNLVINTRVVSGWLTVNQLFCAEYHSIFKY